MEKGKTPSYSLWLGLVRAIRWILRTVAILAALYIFFPPFWDAAFEADLEAFHKAPYIAADRARHLWHSLTDGLRANPGQKSPGLGLSDNRK